jgi:hypothetical protein
MTQIERRQTRIRRIKRKLMSTGAQVEVVATNAEVHHHIGASQNHHEHIPSFVHGHEGDPAVQVSSSSRVRNLADDYLELSAQVEGTPSPSCQGFNITE